MNPYRFRSFLFSSALLLASAGCPKSSSPAVPTLSVAVNAGVETGASRLTVKCAADPGLKPGEAAALLFDEREIHLFDPETGKSLRLEGTR
jgi:hypothetical protein